jgi:ribosome maturation protein Sdo1
MVGKQAVRHGDIAIDRQWNLDEVASDAVANTAALADMLKRTFGTTEMAEIIRGVVASEMARNRTA